jgi:hypothetical protein
MLANVGSGIFSRPAIHTSKRLQIWDRFGTDLGQIWDRFRSQFEVERPKFWPLELGRGQKLLKWLKWLKTVKTAIMGQLICGKGFQFSHQKKWVFRKEDILARFFQILDISPRKKRGANFRTFSCFQGRKDGVSWLRKMGYPPPRAPDRPWAFRRGIPPSVVYRGTPQNLGVQVWKWLKKLKNGF